jgi:hypothetical protein
MATMLSMSRLPVVSVQWCANTPIATTRTSTDAAMATGARGSRLCSPLTDRRIGKIPNGTKWVTEAIAT